VADVTLAISMFVRMALFLVMINWKNYPKTINGSTSSP
jgi:hypothetical protein